MVSAVRHRLKCVEMLQGTSLKRTVALAPLFFGAAHLHHLYELVSLQGRPVGQATQQVGSCAPCVQCLHVSSPDRRCAAFTCAKPAEQPC
jgi:hypothetical protein